MLRISVRGMIFEFEMHPWSGPAILKANGEPRDFQPNYFLEAVSLWSRQGRRMEEGLCRWDHEPEDILEHLGGRHWKIVGCRPAVRGC
jgi:hypothetical protein